MNEKPKRKLTISPEERERRSKAIAEINRKRAGVPRNVSPEERERRRQFCKGIVLKRWRKPGDEVVR